MSLDLQQLEYLLVELQSRLEKDSELWLQYSYLLEQSELDSEKELAQVKRMVLQSLMGLVADSLLQLESHSQRVKEKELALDWDLQ
jgi:hypothetical protein